MSSFILKIIGIVSMLCDHIGLSLVGHFSWLNLVGRMAFPIFAFQISQGYLHTSNLKKYIIRLLIFACISQIPFMLFQSTYNDSFILNVFFTLLLGIISILGYEEIKNRIFGFGFVAIICLIAQLSKVDYGAFGVGSVFLFYFYSSLINKEGTSNKIKLLYKILMCLSFIAIVILKYIGYFIKYPFLFETYFKMTIFTCIPLIFIILYNENQGPKLKYLFYIFYPLHLIILWLVKMFI